MAHRHSRRLFLFPLVIAASLLWVALIVVTDDAQLEPVTAPDFLPQSMGCGAPGAAPSSWPRANSGPCSGFAPINPPPRRRNHHDQRRIDQPPA